jgi:hypothetical protein
LPGGIEARRTDGSRAGYSTKHAGLKRQQHHQRLYMES